MKIGFKSNSQTISCHFNLDLMKNNAIEGLLRLFEVSKVYVCFYGMKTKPDLSKIVATILPANYSAPDFRGSLCDLVLEVNSKHITSLLYMLGDNFDEMIIWSCYSDWDLFIDELMKPSAFFTFTNPKLAESKASFYLHYSLYDCNEVEIICDKQLKDNITKDDILITLQMA